MNEVQKAAVSVSEMARIVGLSRARFYQLMSDGVFPKPKYDESTNRPYYDEEAQAECVLVKRRNVGINGQVVIFYASRHPLTGQPKRASKAKTKPKPANDHADLLDSLACAMLAMRHPECVKHLGPLVPGAGLPGVSWVFGRILNTAEMGALPTLRAATDPAVRGGQYWGPDGFREMRGYPVLVGSNTQSTDVALQQRLWQVSEELTGVTYPV